MKYYVHKKAEFSFLITVLSGCLNSRDKKLFISPNSDFCMAKLQMNPMSTRSGRAYWPIHNFESGKIL